MSSSDWTQKETTGSVTGPVMLQRRCQDRTETGDLPLTHEAVPGRVGGLHSPQSEDPDSDEGTYAGMNPGMVME